MGEDWWGKSTREERQILLMESVLLNEDRPTFGEKKETPWWWVLVLALYAGCVVLPLALVVLGWVNNG